MESYLKVVKLLLKNGAPVNSKDRHNATPIFLAVNCGSCEATQLLIGKYSGLSDGWTVTLIALKVFGTKNSAKWNVVVHRR